MIIKKIVKRTPLYPVVLYWLRVKHRNDKINKLIQEGKDKFSQENPKQGSFIDFKFAVQKHLVSYSEYMYQYEFWRLSESERDDFVSRLQVQRFYDSIPWNIKEVFWNKVLFLKHYKNYIHRDWFFVVDRNFEDFCAFIDNHRCIAKPLDSCCGDGIFLLPKVKTLAEKEELYRKLRTNKALLEECIEGCDEIQRFHPNSLNSIRVVTVVGDQQTVVFGAFIRFGVGNSVVDNAHAGGLFAQINVDTGIIESDAIDVNGTRCSVHPDSNIQITGYKIPRWNDIKQICIEAASIIPQNKITGWDVVINKKGDIEFVEGNHGPDFDLMQSPLKIGVKAKLYGLIPNKCFK